MGESRYDIYEDDEGEYRWRLLADNGEIIAQGESYTRREDAERAVETVKEEAGKAEAGDE